MHKIYCDVPGSHCFRAIPFEILRGAEWKISQTPSHIFLTSPQTKGSLDPCLVTARSQGGSKKTPARWHTTIFIQERAMMNLFRKAAGFSNGVPGRLSAKNTVKTELGFLYHIFTSFILVLLIPKSGNSITINIY